MLLALSLGAALFFSAAITGFAQEATCELYLNKFAAGYDIAEATVVQTASDCCVYCQQVSGCNGFVFASSNASCYAKHLPARFSLVLQSGMVIGTYSTAVATSLPTTESETSAVQTTASQTTSFSTTGHLGAGTTCQLYLNKFASGYDIAPVTVVQAAADCCIYCQQVPGCNGFVFSSSNGSCYAKHLPARFSLVQQSGMVIGTPPTTVTTLLPTSGTTDSYPASLTTTGQLGGADGRCLHSVHTSPKLLSNNVVHSTVLANSLYCQRDSAIYVSFWLPPCVTLVGVQACGDSSFSYSGNYTVRIFPHGGCGLILTFSASVSLSLAYQGVILSDDYGHSYHGIARLPGC